MEVDFINSILLYPLREKINGDADSGQMDFLSYSLLEILANELEELALIEIIFEMSPTFGTSSLISSLFL